MDTQEWARAELAQLIDSSQQYQDQAFYRAVQKLIDEQYRRINQLQGELDGRMWSPEKW